MRAERTLFDKCYWVLTVVLQAVAGLAMIVLSHWAFALVIFQSIGWLRFGVWQPVPGYAMFMSEVAKDRSLRLYEQGLQPLDMMPVFGSASGPQEVAHMAVGDWVGARAVVIWFLELPFGAWLLGAAIAAAAVGAWAEHIRRAA